MAGGVHFCLFTFVFLLAMKLSLARLISHSGANTMGRRPKMSFDLGIAPSLMPVDRASGYGQVKSAHIDPSSAERNQNTMGRKLMMDDEHVSDPSFMPNDRGVDHRHYMVNTAHADQLPSDERYKNVIDSEPISGDRYREGLNHEPPPNDMIAREPDPSPMIDTIRM